MTETKLSDTAARFLEARHARKERGRRAKETPDALFERVARGVAEAELRLSSAKEAARWERAFCDLIASLDFLPGVPILRNAGAALGQLSACAALPVEDSLEGVFGALKDGALLQRAGADVGYSLSHLRPRGDLVASTGDGASGPAAFLGLFDAAAGPLLDRGRGASAAVLRVDHPDVLAFVRAKQGGGLGHLRLSVAVTDDFMDAARSGGTLPLVHPRTRLHAGDLDAREVWEALVEAAWRTGEPSLVFTEAIERNNPTPDLGRIEATSPCGEVPLLPFESCHTGALNLAHMVRLSDGRAEVDWEKLGATTRLAVRFLDDAAEVDEAPISAVHEASRRTRKLGLGVMGFAELLIRLGVPYGSDASLALAERIAHAMDEASLHASQALAEERGVLPAWQGSTYKERGVRVRNATRIAIAPTGALSLLAGTTPDIEPLRALLYRRSGVSVLEESPLFRASLEARGLDAEHVLLEAKHRGVLRGVLGDDKPLFVTALELPPERHLAVQAAFQRHVDGAVTKSIPLPHDASIDDVERAYLRAWESGLKGARVQLRGRRGDPVLDLAEDEEPALCDHARSAAL